MPAPQVPQYTKLLVVVNANTMQVHEAHTMQNFQVEFTMQAIHMHHH
jgi:hypothetical protein